MSYSELFVLFASVSGPGLYALFLIMTTFPEKFEASSVFIVIIASLAVIAMPLSFAGLLTTLILRAGGG